MSLHISSWVWRKSKASGATLLVLLALADISDDDGFSYPGLAHIARKTRLSPRTVRRHIGILEEGSVLTVERRGGRANLYQILTEDPGQISDPQRGDDPGQSDPGQSVTPDTGDRDPGQIVHSLLIPTRQDTSMVNGGSTAEVIDPFDEFWKVYPRRVKKAGAKKAYARALKVASAETILAGAVKFAKSVVGKEPNFIAHAPTWLNDGRWDDEDDTTTAPASAYDRSKEFRKDDYA